MTWPSNPVIYEVDTWPWLTDVRRRFGADVTLADVPSTVWDDLAPPGVAPATAGSTFSPTTSTGEIC